MSNRTPSMSNSACSTGCVGEKDISAVDMLLERVTLRGFTAVYRDDEARGEATEVSREGRCRALAAEVAAQEVLRVKLQLWAEWPREEEARRGGGFSLPAADESCARVECVSGMSSDPAIAGFPNGAKLVPAEWQFGSRMGVRLLCSVERTSPQQPRRCSRISSGISTAVTATSARAGASRSRRFGRRPPRKITSGATREGRRQTDVIQQVDQSGEIFSFEPFEQLRATPGAGNRRERTTGEREKWSLASLSASASTEPSHRVREREEARAAARRTRPSARAPGRRVGQVEKSALIRFDTRRRESKAKEERGGQGGASRLAPTMDHWRLWRLGSAQPVVKRVGASTGGTPAMSKS